MTAAHWAFLVCLVIVADLLVFGYVFSINSSVHALPVLAFSKDDRVRQDVGFYYMVNAAGRLLGTLLSGSSYQIGGLPLCLATSGLMAVLIWLSAHRLAPNHARVGPKRS